MTGILYGIGAGPGDPELLTVKAFRILSESRVIAFPKKRSGEKSYARQIIDAYIDPQEKDMLGLVFPMTKDPVILEREWNKAAEAVAEKLESGENVAFVTEGDPMLYSTFIHMKNVLQKRMPNVKTEVVPGISSVNGTAARLNIPLADGDEHVAIIPATDDRDALKRAIETHDCVIFLKVAKVAALISSVIRELGLEAYAHAVTKVTSSDEVIWTLDEFERAEPNYLTLMVVKKK